MTDEQTITPPPEPEPAPEPKPKPRDPRALNAYRHGLTGQIVIQTPEDQAAYDTHCQGIRRIPRPRRRHGNRTRAIRRRRPLAPAARRRHRKLHLRHRLGEGPGHFTAHHEQIDTAFDQAVTWLKEGKNLQLLTLYEGRIQRRVEKNMAMLLQLQEKRQAALQKAVEEATLLAQLAASKGESYDIERDFPREALPPQFVFSLAQIALLAAHNRRLTEAKKQFHAPQKSLRQAA